jgi:outer membrane protein insertion porin family
MSEKHESNERHQAKISSYIESFKIHKAKYKTDLEKVIASYKEQGYRDARIISLATIKTNALFIKINVEEEQILFWEC